MKNENENISNIFLNAKGRIKLKPLKIKPNLSV